jgi:hypothetical protein
LAWKPYQKVILDGYAVHPFVHAVIEAYHPKAVYPRCFQAAPYPVDDNPAG